MGRKLKFDELEIPITEVKAFVENYIYSKKNREIIQEKWCDGITYEDLAEKYDMSSRQMFRIVNNAEKTFKKINHIPS